MLERCKGRAPARQHSTLRILLLLTAAGQHRGPRSEDWKGARTTARVSPRRAVGGRGREHGRAHVTLRSELDLRQGSSRA